MKLMRMKIKTVVVWLWQAVGRANNHGAAANHDEHVRRHTHWGVYR